MSKSLYLNPGVKSPRNRWKNNIHCKTKRMTRITANRLCHRIALINNLKYVWFKISGQLTRKSEWLLWILSIQKITCSKKFWWVKNKQTKTPKKLLLLVSIAKKKDKTNTAFLLLCLLFAFSWSKTYFIFWEVLGSFSLQDKPISSLSLYRHNSERDSGK